jgi:hypothetical protein
MTFHEYLAKARQYDAQQAAEHDRLIQRARRNLTARRQGTGPTGRARRLARLIFRPWKRVRRMTYPPDSAPLRDRVQVDGRGYRSG